MSAELDTRLKEMSGQMEGPLLIGASTTLAEFLLPQILGEFKSRNPAVVPRLFVANSESVQDRVAERSLDLGFIEGDSHLPSLVTDVCCEDELQIVCAPGHALAKQKSVSPQALSGHAYISREPGSGTRMVALKVFEQHGLSPRIRMELSTDEAIREAILAGLGVSILSRYSLGLELEATKLACLDVEGFPIERHWHFIYPVGKQLSVTARAFMDFARVEARRLVPDAFGPHPR